MPAGSSIAWLNGQWLPLHEASISPLDRGFLFGDAIYEVIPVIDGIPLLLDSHLQRLAASLVATRIDNPYSDGQWRRLVSGLIKRNGAGSMGLYIQVSRGADHSRERNIPAGLVPTVFALVLETGPDSEQQTGCKAILLNDDRWLHCDIKSTSMLANVLLEMQAREQGADEAILIRDGYLTEGTSTSVVIVENNILLTRPNGPELLPGTTVHRVLAIALQAGIQWREEKISAQQLRKANEIWLMSATRDIVPVTRLDGAAIGTGRPGPLWKQISELYAAWKQEQIRKAQKNISGPT